MITKKSGANGNFRRIGILAAGQVGRSVLSEVLKHAPDHLAAIMVDEDSIIAGLTIPHHCEVSSWPTLSDEEKADWLISRKIDVLILAWWPYLLKGEMLQTAPVILNMHPSLLPHCRGKDPNFWSIVEEAPFGVTLHHVNAGIDAGDIAFQRQIPINWTDTGASLYGQAQNAMVSLFVDSLPAIVYGEIPRIAQAETGSIHFRNQLEAASLIDLDAPTTARSVLNRLRARTFQPHPACRFEDAGETYEVRVSIERLGDRSDGA